MDVLFLGTSGAVPTPERGLSATLLKRGGERFLVDCGEGTQRQLMRAGVGINQISTILLTHMHADHFLGLPGMLKTWQLWGREDAVDIYGPRGMLNTMTPFKRVIGHTDYTITYHEVDPGPLFVRDGFTLSAFRTDHRVPSAGYSLQEMDRPGRFDLAAAQALGVTPGPDFGRLQRGEPVMGKDGWVTPEMVLGASRAGRKLVVTGDTRPCDTVLAAAQDADVLVHDSTFTREAEDRARETYHSTSTEAALLAREAQVRLLALTHLSFRHSPKELLAEARAVNEAVVLPSDLDRILVPFEERGGPQFIDYRQERQAQRAQQAANDGRSRS